MIHIGVQVMRWGKNFLLVGVVLADSVNFGPDPDLDPTY
jgi:hypothetical protein